MPFEKVDANVEIDRDTNAFRITGEQGQVGIVFHTNAHLVGKFEEPGVRNLALRAAIDQTEQFFLERYAMYLAAIENDPKFAALLNAVADSTSSEEVLVNVRDAGNYMVDSLPDIQDAAALQERMDGLMSEVEALAAQKDVVN